MNDLPETSSPTWAKALSLLLVGLAALLWGLLGSAFAIGFSSKVGNGIYPFLVPFVSALAFVHAVGWYSPRSKRVKGGFALVVVLIAIAAAQWRLGYSSPITLGWMALGGLVGIGASEVHANPGNALDSSEISSWPSRLSSLGGAGILTLLLVTVGGLAVLAAAGWVAYEAFTHP